MPTFQHVFQPGASPRTLLLLHGTGGTEHDLLELGRSLDPTAALLSPRGRALEHGMPRFFRRLAEGVFDQADLAKQTDDLAAFVREACATNGRDPARVVAVGFSNGANIAASLLLRQPDVLAGAALLRSMTPFVPDVLPDLRGRSILVCSGDADAMVSGANVERLVGLLRAGGASVAHHRSPGGHGLTQQDVDAARQWMADLAA